MIELNQNSPEKIPIIFRIYAFLSVISMFVILWIVIGHSRPWGFHLFDYFNLFYIMVLVLLSFTVYGIWFMKPWLRRLLYVLLILSIISTIFTIVANLMTGSRSIIAPLFFFGSLLYLLATIFVLIKLVRNKV